MKELTNEQLKILADENYTFLGMFKKGKETRLKIRHNLCGKEYDVRVSRFFSEGQRCACLRKRGDFKIDTVLPSEYSIVSEYLGKKKPITIKHSCGFEYTIKRAEYLEQGGKSALCPVCNTGQKNSIDRMNFLFNKLGLDIVIAEDEVEEKGKQKYKVLNRSCNHEYTINYLDVLNTRRCTCPICRKKHKPDITIDFVKKEIEELDSDYEVRSTEYNGTHEHLTMYHKKCKKEYQVSRTNFLSGKRCPHCSQNLVASKGELEMLSFIQQYEPTAGKQRFTKDNKTFEIDIYIPDKKIGFEYNGLYWHSDEKKDKMYHYDKMMFFKDMGIHLVQFFSDEWEQKREIVEDKIRSLLGATQRKIYARKCYIKEIKSTERNNFLNKYHIQGADKANISLGLFHDSELVAVMSFISRRKALGQTKQEGVFELSRFCTIGNTSVIGAFSKLLKYAQKNYNIQTIITYADLRLSNLDNNVYKSSGFELDHISAPSYWYVSSSMEIREHRFNYCKHKLKSKFPDSYSDSLTENEIMKLNHFSRVWDCGNAVYKKIN